MTKPGHSQPVWVRALLALPPHEYRVWSYLFWRQGLNDFAYPSQETMAKELHLSEQRVREITRALQDKGWLAITRPDRQGRRNYLRYAVTSPQKGSNVVEPSESKGSNPSEPLEPERVKSMTRKGSNPSKTNTYKNTIKSKGTHSAPTQTRGKTPRKAKRPAFVPPTVDQVRDYAESRGDPDFEADTFMEYYTRTGWKRKNGTPVQDWKATVREWMKRNDARRIERGEPPHDGYSQYGTHEATPEEAEAALRDNG